MAELYKKKLNGGWLSELKRRSGENAYLSDEFYNCFRKRKDDLKAELERHEKMARARRKNSLESHWELALVLIDVIEDASYSVVSQELEEYRKTHPNEYDYRWAFAQGTQVFLYWCASRLGLCRRSVYNLLQVVETYRYTMHSTDEYSREIRSGYKVFGYTQLVLMLPLSEEQRKKVMPNWTIVQIREYCKFVHLNAQSSLDAEEEPDESDKDEIADEPPKNEKYERFAKWKKEQLCDHILILEDKLKSAADERTRMLVEIDKLHAKLGRRQAKTATELEQEDAVLTDDDETAEWNGVNQLFDKEGVML